MGAQGLSRRTFVRGLMVTGGAVGLAACGGEAQPAPVAPAPTAATAAVTGAGTSTAAPAQPAFAPGKLAVWFTANWNTVTDDAVGAIFTEWGKKNNTQVEWQATGSSPQYLANEAAAVAAGTPPEIDNGNNIYWYSQGERADVSGLVSKFKDKAGGMPPISIASTTAPDGKVFAAPYAIDPWPAQWRKDLIGAKTGGRFFNTYEEMVELGPSIQTPPQTYVYAMSTGHEGDHVNNLVTLLWAYGGRLADENGVPDIKNPANKAALDIALRLWKAKLIPPDSAAATVTSWNNETYQKRRGLVAINPATIYGWCVVNDKELADNTGLAIPPKGSAGQFAEAASPAFGIFKKAKAADRAQAALEYFMQPEQLQKVSSSVEGRYVPVYRDHLKTEFWQKGAFVDLKSIGEVGRIREWPAKPQAWLADVTDARFTLADMLQKIFSGEMAVEKAQEWAQADMMDSYNKNRQK